MNTILLDLLAFGAIISAILVITSKNPVISVLFLISVFINAAGYLLILGIGFIGISYLIVYVGAIAILFLFVIIMLNIQLTEIVSIGREYTQNLPLGLIMGSLLILELLSIIPLSNTNTSEISLSMFNYLNRSILSLNNNYNSVGMDNVNLTFIGPIADNNISEFQQIQSIGHSLYTYGSFWLLLCSIILMLAILGPIVLCLHKSNK